MRRLGFLRRSVQIAGGLVSEAFRGVSSYRGLALFGIPSFLAIHFPRSPTEQSCAHCCIPMPSFVPDEHRLLTELPGTAGPRQVYHLYAPARAQPAHPVSKRASGQPKAGNHA